MVPLKNENGKALTVHGEEFDYQHYLDKIRNGEKVNIQPAWVNSILYTPLSSRLKELDRARLIIPMSGNAASVLEMRTIFEQYVGFVDYVSFDPKHPFKEVTHHRVFDYDIIEREEENYLMRSGILKRVGMSLRDFMHLPIADYIRIKKTFSKIKEDEQKAAKGLMDSYDEMDGELKEQLDMFD